MVTSKKTKGLKFEYCECGCKGYECSPGSNIHYWIYWDLKTKFYLHSGHSFLGPHLGTFPTLGKAVGHATKLFKKELKKLQSALSV